MRSLLYVGLLAAALAPGATIEAADKDKAPDLSAMVQLVGRFGIAHACPVGPDSLYTAAHVVAERPFDNGVSLFPLRMEQEGLEGVVFPVTTDRASDFAFLHSSVRLPKWFPLVSERPKPGERLWNIGYKWEERKNYPPPLIVDGVITRVVAGHLFVSASAGHGSSGGCWVNARGEAVALEVWTMECGAGDDCAGAVGLWPPWQYREDSTEKKQ